MTQTKDMCACGCGEPLPPRKDRFKKGHWNRQLLPDVREDRGYATRCLIAQGGNRGGYVQRNRKIHGAVKKYWVHRQAWEDYHGRPIPKGWHVHHLCKQPGCCEPTHLELRQGGEHARMHSAKLTIEQVREIRVSSLSAVKLAAKFGVSKFAVRNIRNGKSWVGVE